MDTYCLGYTHAKCETCQHEANWQMLNQTPDALRKALQQRMHQVDSDACRLTKMGEHVPKTTKPEGE